MAGGHHPRRPVEHRPEVVPVPQFGFAGRDAHADRQLKLPLRVDRRVDGRHRRGKRRSHPVPGVAEQEAIVCLDRGAQHLVMRGQRHPHPVRV